MRDLCSWLNKVLTGIVLCVDTSWFNDLKGFCVCIQLKVVILHEAYIPGPKYFKTLKGIMSMSEL